MCGIVGAIGMLNAKEDKAVQIMMQLDVIRGKDSTGIVAVDNKRDWAIAKEAWLPQDLLVQRQCKEIFASFQNYIYLAHNRAATVGAVNKAGAHPFEFEHVVGVHNGTTNKSLFDNADDYDVDSQALYDQVNTKGVDSMWGKVSGAASLAFFDKRTDRFHLLRNSERPMFIAFSKSGSVMYYASEAWMIHVACNKAKVELDEKFGVKATEVNKLYSFNAHKPSELKKFTTKDVKPYVKPTLLYSTPVLNTWATGVEGLRPNQEIHFTVDSIVKGTSNQKIVNITSTSTKKPIKGRVYIYETVHAEILKEFEDRVAGEEFCGDIVSVSTFGATRGFVVKATSSYSLIVLDELQRGNDDEDCLFIDGVDGYIDRAMFQKGDKVNACCNCCDDPLDFDSGDFLYVGVASGKFQFVCNGCKDIATNLFPSVTLKDVTKYAMKH